jgi:hypothetical protein
MMERPDDGVEIRIWRMPCQCDSPRPLLQSNNVWITQYKLLKFEICFEEAKLCAVCRKQLILPTSENDDRRRRDPEEEG